MNFVCDFLQSCLMIIFGLAPKVVKKKGNRETTPKNTKTGQLISGLFVPFRGFGLINKKITQFKFFWCIVFICFLSSLFFLPVIAQEKNASTFIEGSSNEWFVETTDRAPDARVAEFLGRQALWLKNGTQVMRSGLEFVDGTIEFDMAPMDKGNFVGIIFRRNSFSDHENVYLRLHRSGLYNAVQYAPRTNAPTWQLYPEFNAVADFQRNQWTHVRVEVRGTRMEVYVSNKAQPVLVVPRLRGLSAKGTVAFWGRVNQQPAVWAAALSNISIRPLNSTTRNETIRPAPPAGTLTSWEVANPVKNEKGMITSLPELKDWRAVEVEESGLINLNRALGRLSGRWTAFARTAMKANEAKTVLLELGYSDEVTVFLNGQPIYSGINGFDSRHPEYMGFVKPEHENVFLNLRPGNNEIVLAVSDDQRFGWGFIARLKERTT
jgi:hypothetical protein